MIITMNIIIYYDYFIIIIIIYYYYYYYFTIIFIIILIVSIIIIHILTIPINNCQTIFSLFRIVKNTTLLSLFQKDIILSLFQNYQSYKTIP
jgi:hypothetical protein